MKNLSTFIIYLITVIILISSFACKSEERLEREKNIMIEKEVEKRVGKERIALLEKEIDDEFLIHGPHILVEWYIIAENNLRLRQDSLNVLAFKKAEIEKMRWADFHCADLKEKILNLKVESIATADE